MSFIIIYNCTNLGAKLTQRNHQVERKIRISLQSLNNSKPFNSLYAKGGKSDTLVPITRCDRCLDSVQSKSIWVGSSSRVIDESWVYKKQGQPLLNLVGVE